MFYGGNPSMVDMFNQKKDQRFGDDQWDHGSPTMPGMTTGPVGDPNSRGPGGPSDGVQTGWYQGKTDPTTQVPNPGDGMTTNNQSPGLQNVMNMPAGAFGGPAGGANTGDRGGLAMPGNFLGDPSTWGKNYGMDTGAWTNPNAKATFGGGSGGAPGVMPGMTTNRVQPMNAMRPGNSPDNLIKGNFVQNPMADQATTNGLMSGMQAPTINRNSQNMQIMNGQTPSGGNSNGQATTNNFGGNAPSGGFSNGQATTNGAVFGGGNNTPTGGNSNGQATTNNMPGQQPNMSSQALQFLRQQSNSGWSPNQAFGFRDPQSGNIVMPQDGPNGLEGYNEMPPNAKVGDQYKKFGPNGEFLGFDTIKEVDDKMMMALFAAATGAMMMLPGGLFSGTYGQGTWAAQHGMEAGPGFGSVPGGSGVPGAPGNNPSAYTPPGSETGLPGDWGPPADYGPPSDIDLPGDWGPTPPDYGNPGLDLPPNPTVGPNGPELPTGPSPNNPGGTPLPGGGSGIPGGGLPGGGGNNGGNGFNLGNLLGLLGAAYGGNQTKQASDDMLAWLKEQQRKVDSVYAPGSPEYDYLWKQMSAKDAAAGRNSQYGPRSTELGAKLADIKAGHTVDLTKGIGHLMASSLNQGANAYAGIPAILGAMGGGGGVFDNIDLGDLTGWLDDLFGGD